MEYENDVSRSIASVGEDENKQAIRYTVWLLQQKATMSASGVSISRSE